MPETSSVIAGIAVKQGLVFLRWCCCALVLSAFSALCCCLCGLDSYIGYICSIVSFLSAFFAFGFSERKTFTEKILTGIVLTGLILLCGVLAGDGLDTSAVLSLSSFTFCGCICAGLFANGKGYKRKNKGKKIKLIKHRK